MVIASQILTAVAAIAMTGNGIGMRAWRASVDRIFAKNTALITMAMPRCVNGTSSFKAPLKAERKCQIWAKTDGHIGRWFRVVVCPNWERWLIYSGPGTNKHKYILNDEL
jgi:hypothetical protein